MMGQRPEHGLNRVRVAGHDGFVFGRPRDGAVLFKASSDRALKLEIGRVPEDLWISPPKLERSVEIFSPVYEAAV